MKLGRVSPAIALLLAAPSAHAYCRTTTVSVAADFQPSPTKCWEQGAPLFWRNACVGYALQRDASRQASLDDASRIASHAFTRWSGASCPTDGIGQSQVSIDVRYTGPVDCGEVRFNPDGPNQNVIVFRDDAWTHASTGDTLAITTVTFSAVTGEIYDADMEVNTRDQQIVLDDPVPPDGYDFASIMTHEAGHFLGLAHSGDRGSTMFFGYAPGATAMRNLTTDDIAGICSAYPANGNRETSKGKVPALPCDPTFRKGSTSECAPPEKSGCAIVPPNFDPANSNPARFVELGGLVASAVAIRRARHRRSSRRRVC